MVTTFYPPRSFGGDAVAVQSLARALVRAGHDVTVVCDDDAFRTLSRRRDAPPPEANDGIVVHRLRSAFGAVAVALTQQTGRPLVHGETLDRLLGEGNFDVIHFHNLSLVGGPAALAYGTRSSSTRHTSTACVLRMSCGGTAWNRAPVANACDASFDMADSATRRHTGLLERHSMRCMPSCRERVQSSEASRVRVSARDGSDPPASHMIPEHLCVAVRRAAHFLRRPDRTLKAGRRHRPLARFEDADP